jgi:hypothetical protein
MFFSLFKWYIFVNTSRSFPRSWLITGLVTRLTRRVSLVEQEPPTLPEHLSSPPVFSGVRVTRSLILYVFCWSLFVFLYIFFWSLCCLFFFDIRILITLVVSFGHCVVCSSSIYGFWLPLWYLLVIVLSVLLRYTDSDYPCGIFWSLCCLFFFDIRILITLVVSFGHCVVYSSSIYGFWLPLWYLLAIVLSILLRYTDSDCPFGIFKLFFVSTNFNF